jgi:putative ABC transport system permease protein
MLKSLGLVPGVMTGMMVSGASPVYAGIYQFVIVAMILAASGIAGLIVTLLMRTRTFSTAAQLTLRAGKRGPSEWRRIVVRTLRSLIRDLHIVDRFSLGREATS